MNAKVISPDTLCAQALGRVERETRAIIPPIHLSTTFERAPDNSYPGGLSYIRDDNPAQDNAQDLLSALEGGTACLLFASGMAAATSLFLALKPGEHVIAPTMMYYGVRVWLMGNAKQWGIEVDFVDTTDLAAVRAAIRPGRTRLIWAETPANPLWRVTDLAALAGIAHGAGALLAVDSTVATPILTRPIEHGADFVMHSATKYLNGHSDVLAGALVAARRDDFWSRVVAVRKQFGAMLGGFECWLLLRGMRTLPLRVRRASQTALSLAQSLSGHPGLVAVLYPGLTDFPDHAIARRQMTGGFGGMLSIRIEGGAAGAIGCAGRVKLWKRATSLGGVESLIEHRASIEGSESQVPDDLLRLSCGLEDEGELLADLKSALA